MKHILIILSLFLFSLTIISCASSSDDGASTTSDNTTSSDDTTTTTDTTSPLLLEVNVVTTPTDDNTPNYTFYTTESGTITYGGSCSSGTTSATIGNNTITFIVLSDGTYSNCTITVTDSAGNTSNTLEITSFTVDTTDNTTSSSATAVFDTSLFNSSYFGD